MIASVGILNTAAAAEYIGLSKSTLEKARIYGGGPPFVRVTSRAVRYRMQDLEAWMLERLVSSTSAPR
jgi:predicted DNA-binding transcriptional regulator AlpA